VRLLSFGLVFSMVVAEAQHGPDLDRLLNQWAAAGAPSEEVVAGVMSQIDLRNADLEKQLVERIQQAGKARGASAGAAFENEVKLALDQYRYAQVQKVLDSVYAKYGGGLEAAVRTGSSGIRHMNMGAQSAPEGYRFLFSDDDISFVGRRGVEAAEAFNAGIRNAGLGKVKVSGFDLITLKNVRSLDLTALDLLEPEKFLGASGLGGIKKEMLKNGAVIAKNAGTGMAATAEPLAAFVEAKESAMLAELLDEKAIVGVVEKYGSMTMVASCERQIVEAHGGWEKLTPPERVKYVLRQRLALRQSGALRDIASLGGSAIDAEIAWLQKLKAAGTLTPQENAYLLSMRGENVRLAFAEIPTKLNPILAAAEADGRSLAANPEVRKAIEELATGFALLGKTEMALPEAQILAELRRIAGDSKEMYSILHTAYQQGKDLMTMVEYWRNTGGTRAAFVEMLEKTADRAEKLAMARARKAAQAGKAEAKSLTVLEEMLGTAEGEGLFLKLARSPSAKKYLIATLGTAGGAVILNAAYKSWMQGDAKFREDLSGVAITLLEAVPGGMSLTRAITEGVDAQTAFLFVKDALYFTPAWPLVLTADVISFGWDVSSSMRVANFQDGLVDVFVYNGQFERAGDGYKFRGLVPPGSPLIPQSGLRNFLFETKTVRVNHAMAGKTYIISDLSAASTTVLDKVFIPNDRILQEMRAAAEQQMNAINRSAAWAGITTGVPYLGAAGLANWISGSDTSCKDSVEKWCKVFGALQKQVTRRREVVISEGMIPQLIEMAEAKRLKLDAPSLYEAKLADMQKQFEKLRGSPLGVNLVEAVKKAAAAKAAEVRTDTGEDRAVKGGEVWETSFTAYKRILAISESMPQNLAARTGYDRARVLQFKWTGKPADDLRKAEQSKAGYAAMLRRVTVDVRAAKQAEPDVNEPVDREAFGLLAEVAFGYRAALDEADEAEPGAGSPFQAAYAQAQEKVKLLYGRSAEFQTRLDKGATIVKEKDALTAEQSTGLELRFSDAGLQEDLKQGRLSLKWSSTPAGEYRPNPEGAAVRFVPGGLEPAKVVVRVVRNAASKEQGTVSVQMPVQVGLEFLSLALTPTAPGPNQMFAAEASVPDRYLGGRGMQYRWQCSNCSVEDVNRFKTAVRSPDQGAGTVTVTVVMDDGKGQKTVLATKSAPFTVGVKEPPAAESAVTAKVAGLKAELAAGAKAEAFAQQFQRSGKAAAGEFKVLWTAKPALEFTPKETTGEGHAKVQFPGPGLYTVWGEIRQGGKKVGECAKFDVTIKGSEFTVTLSAAPQSLKPGQNSALTAEVAGGGTPPLIYNWTGAGGDGKQALFSSMKGGSFPVAVKVTDASGRSSSASLSIKVNAVDGKIAGLPNKVYYGTRQKISVQTEGAPPPPPAADPCAGKPRSNNPFDDCNTITVMQSAGVSVAPKADLPTITASDVRTVAAAPAAVAPAAVSGAIEFIYQSDVGLAFDPPQSAGPTSVLINHMPSNRKAKVWAQIVKKEGAIFSTVGETPQQEIEITPPEFELVFDPPAQMMGKEVKATVKTRPAIEEKLLTYKWSTPESSNRMEYAQNSSVIGFVAKTKVPVKLLAGADSPYSERVGSVDGAFTPSQYVVQAKITGPLGPQPMVWQEGVGLVPVPRTSFAADQMVQAEAAIQGEPAPAEVRWSWTVNEGTTLQSATTAREVRVSRHETGGAELTVEARDANGVVLGRAKAGFAVTISAEQLTRRPLTVKAQAEKELIGTGDSTNLRAAAEGGKPPYTYTWSGGTQGSGPTLAYRAAKAGKYPVTLTVRDAEGKQATATVTLDVRAVVLQVELTADLAALTAGDTARLTATAKNVRAPLQYQWTGEVTGSGPTVQFPAGEAGTKEVQVTVTDSRGNAGSKKLALTVKAMALRFASHPAKAAFGEKMPLTVNLPAGAWTTVFHASPEIEFAPKEANDARTTATFARRGSVRIWAEVLKNGKPAGRVTEEDVEVALPKFEISFDPAKAGVGEDVTAIVRSTETLNPALYKYDWKRMPAGARVLSPDRIQFSAKDYNPVEFIVDAVSTSGENLGEMSKQFVPTTLVLKAQIVGPVPPLPQLMRDGKLTDVTDAYAVNEKVKVSAGFEIKPPAGVQYAWTLPKGCLSSSPVTAPEMVVYRTTTGDCLLQVTARTAKGGRIGEATVKVPVTLSQADLDRSKQDSARGDALKKLEEAERLAAAKRFDEARTLIEEAAKFEPVKANVTRGRVASMAAGAANLAVADLNFPAAVGYMDTAARINPSDAELAAGRKRIAGWQQDWQQAQTLAGQFDAMLAARRLPTAETILTSIQKLVTPIPAAPKTGPWYDALAAKARAARPEYLAYLEPYRKKIPESLKAKSYAQANTLCQQALQRELYPDNEKEIRDWMKQAQQQPANEAPPAKKRSIGDVLTTAVKVLDTVGQAADQISKSTGTSAPATTPAASGPSGEVTNNMNTGGCSLTDTANFKLAAATRLERINLWFSWEANEQSIAYTLSGNGQTLRSGQLTRGGCDPNQRAWCQATDAINLDLNAGTYVVKTGRARVCQNSGTGGNGMIVATGSPRTSPAVPPPAVIASAPAATAPAPTPKPVVAAPATTADPCAGKPRSNNPYDDCNQITVMKSVGVSVAPSTTLPPLKSVIATVKNESGQPTHIFADGDTFGPTNRLAPGETRRVTLVLPASGRIRFTAGRDGKVIEQRNWDGDPSDTKRVPSVVFSAGEKLIVVTSLN
jgi:hypothetical protein